MALLLPTILWQTYAHTQMVCTGQPPWHRQSYSTLSLPGGASISLWSRVLQSGHKTATTQSGMCVEFLLSLPSESPHPWLQPLLLATSLTHALPHPTPRHTRTHTAPITCQNEMCWLPLEVLANLTAPWQNWHSTILRLKYEVSVFHIKGYWSLLRDRCKSECSEPLQPPAP